MRRVQGVVAKSQPVQSYNNLTYQNGTTAANKGSTFGYIMGGTDISNNDEIFKAFCALYNQTTLAGITGNSLVIRSICLDFMVTNNGTDPVIVDVYRLKMRKSLPTSTTLSSQFTTCVADVVASPNGTANTLAADDLGITVFDVPTFCRNWQVLEKREMIIGGSNTITLQMRNAKKKYVRGRDVSYNGQGLPGYSEAFFITWHGAPDNSGGSGAAQFAATAITVGTSISMKYTQPPGSQQVYAGQSDE
jgi:hypothetical protein